MSKVDKKADEIIENTESVQRGYKTKCWEYKGEKDRKGYGVKYIYNDGKKFHARAHKIVAESYFGKPIPAKWVILHKCDNPPCVRPDHLSVGSQKDNVKDAIKKGRHVFWGIKKQND